MPRALPGIFSLLFVSASTFSTSTIAQVTERVSVTSAGAQASARSLSPALSADGRCIVFVSEASDLVPGDTNGCRDIFVRDRFAGTTERVSVSGSGTQGNGDSDSPVISADGRIVAFRSLAADLVAGDTNGCSDVFVHDRLSGTTVRASVSSAGVPTNGGCTLPSLDASGLLLVFGSSGDNLVPNDTNLRDDVFLRDLVAGTTVRVSVSTAGVQGNSGSDEPIISADGRVVTFDCNASNLVPGDTNGCEDVLMRDLLAGTTERVGVGSGGLQPNAETGQSSLSFDGRFVCFYSIADNLVPGDTNQTSDTFVHDRLTGTTERVNVSSSGGESDHGSISAWISGDGHCVSFVSFATNLAPGDTNGVSDIYLHDRVTGTTERISISSGGAQADLPSLFDGISADGRWVAFGSEATTLVSGDTNATGDIFVRDRLASGATSLCDPGSGGVIVCPCGNPPSGAGHGCDNSSATGGAALAASGIAYLASDSLVFTTVGEKPTATSIVLQGDALVPNGAVFGQGVRCAGGTLQRLYTKTAVAGSIVAPDFAAGDLSVSARTAQLGVPITPGSLRYYMVYYRDPIVLGGCLSTSTFNATQSGSVLWNP